MNNSSHLAQDQRTGNAPGRHEHERIVEALCAPAAYPESTAEVERIETHISWVFLTDEHVYKLKKPLTLDFLDYGTLEARRSMCREEVRLNRRLARDVYLNVQRVTSDEQGSVRIDGSGDTIDWVVKMRRLPAAMCLSNVIDRGGPTDELCNGLQRKLAAFYRSLPREKMDADEYRERLIGLVSENRDELVDSDHDFSAIAVKRLHASQLQMLELEAEAFANRVEAGCIVEGHGDLRPEHIYFDPLPLIIDCIEFNRQIRQLDVLDELCFFEMECDRLGKSSVGRQLTDGIGVSLRDSQPARLRNFYKCYRACVRAKVAAIRAAQLDSESQPNTTVLNARAETRQYLELAEQYESEIGSSKLIVVRGLMGTGKTAVAARIAQRLGAEHVMTDRIRRDLFDDADQRPGYGQGRYSRNNRLRVYTEMFRRAADLLQSGLSVVLDGTFLSAGLRMSAYSLASRYGASCAILRCHCPRDTSIERIARRDDDNVLSEARPELFDQQCREDDAKLAAGHETDLRTVGSLEASVATALEHVKVSCHG